jgi:hypothetical protein
MHRRTIIDEATARRLAVSAECDPRTIRKVLRGDEVKGLAGIRATRILREAGLLEAATVPSLASPALEA